MGEVMDPNKGTDLLGVLGKFAARQLNAVQWELKETMVMWIAIPLVLIQLMLMEK